MPTEIKTLSTEECIKFLDYFKCRTAYGLDRRNSTRDNCMALLMMDAGLRVGEVTKLVIDDLWFSEHPAPNLIVRPPVAKNHKERIVPVTNRLSDAIHTCAREVWPFEIALFVNPAFCRRGSQQALTRRQVERIVSEIGHKTIGRRVTPHMLRHTFATRLMQRTNIRVVQQLLGHSSLQSTQIYTHPNHDDLTNAIRSLE